MVGSGPAVAPARQVDVARMADVDVAFKLNRDLENETKTN